MIPRGFSTRPEMLAEREKLARARAEQRTGISPSPFIAFQIIFILRGAICETLCSQLGIFNMSNMCALIRNKFLSS